MAPATPVERVGQPPRSDEMLVGGGELTPMQEHFLARLDELIASRAEQMRKDPSDKLALRLLSRALYATYMDLVSCDLGEVASARLEKAQSNMR